MQTRYWQFHVRPLYPRPRKRSRRTYIATVTSTVGPREHASAYAMTLPHPDRNAAARAARELIRQIFELETDVLVAAELLEFEGVRQ